MTKRVNTLEEKFVFLHPMIVYNETIIVEETIYTEWLDWMRSTHIPAIMATGLFKYYKILKVIDSPNEGITSCVQYYTDELAHINKYFTEHLSSLNAVHQQRYENKFVIFNSLMETIDEG
jgi:hypothetical protein